MIFLESSAAEDLQYGKPYRAFSLLESLGLCHENHAHPEVSMIAKHALNWEVAAGFQRKFVGSAIELCPSRVLTSYDSRSLLEWV